KDRKACPACRGSGRRARGEGLTANIPPGVKGVAVSRAPGQGGAGFGGGSRGDLYLRVHLLPHEHLRLQNGGDIEVALPFARWEAVLGGKVEVPTLDGPVEMRIPPNSQAGKTLRMKGRGLARPGGGQSDQYVRLKIVVPPKPTEKELKLLKDLARESDFNARKSWN